MENITFESLDNFSKTDLKFNLISCVIFNNKKNYKDYMIYLEGLKLLIKDCIKKKYLLFIYYDESVYSFNFDFDNLLKLNRNQIYINFIKYKCELFYENNFHEGLFGLIIRYVPLFIEYKNIENVMILDVDVDYRTVCKKLNLYRSFIRTENDVHILTSNSCDLSHRFLAYENIFNFNFKYWPRILGHSLISKIKFPKYIFDDFMNIIIMNTNDWQNFINEITNFIKWEKKMNLEQGRFPYGIDELFLEFILKFIYDNKIKFNYSLVTYSLRVPFFFWYENNELEIVGKFLNILNFEGYDLNNTIEENYNNFLEFINKNRLGGKFYEFFLNATKFINLEDYGFNKKCIDGIYREIESYNNKKYELINFYY